MKKNNIIFLTIIFILLSTFNFTQAQELGKVEDGNIYVLPIKGDITKASYNFLKKNLNALDGVDPSCIIFEIDTYGGLIDEAIKIKDLIMDLDYKTVSFVNNKAESAGVLLTISAEDVVMSKRATIGSAEPIPFGEKVLSMWRGVLRDTAQNRSRNPELIESMADKRIEIDGIKEAGELLNLTSKEALDLGIADFLAEDYEEIRKDLNLGEGEVIVISEDLAVKFSKYISNPAISSTLLTLGILGFVIEVLTTGFGFGATMSILSFGLYFGGNIMAGYGELTSIVIFITGILLLIIELVVPGFGLPGISGIILTVLGIALAAESLALSIKTLVIAIIAAIIIAIIIFRTSMKSKRMDKIILSNKLDKENNFLARDSKDQYLGREGIAVTSLRPSGYIMIDGERLDAMAEGGFIEEGSSLKVVKVEGAKISVREIG